MHFSGVVTIYALFLLRGGKSQVSLSRTTPSGMLSVCPNVTAIFTCRVTGSLTLAWTSAEYIGQNLVEFTISDMEGTTMSVNDDVVAELTQNSGSILESELRVRASVNSSISCLPDNANNRENVTFTVYNGFPGRPTILSAIEANPNDDVCFIAVQWSSPGDTSPADIKNYILRNSLNADFEESTETFTLVKYPLNECTSNLSISVTAVDRCEQEGPSSANVMPAFLPRINDISTRNGTPSTTAAVNTPSTFSEPIIALIVVIVIIVVLLIVTISVIIVYSCKIKELKANNDAMLRPWIPPDAVWSWKDYKEIYVEFMNVELLAEWTINDGERMSIDTVLRYANTWSDMGGGKIPRFVEVKHGRKAQIRVKFNNDRVCTSQLGKTAQCVLAPHPTMNLDLHNGGLTDELKKYLIIHMFGRALGLSYEHQRSDFCSSIKPFINTEQMKKDLERTDEQFANDWAKLNSEIHPHKEEYDPDSIMHYWFKVKWLTNGYSDKKKVEADMKKVEEDQENSILSDKDAKAILGVHKRRWNPPTEPSPLDIRLLKELYDDTNGSSTSTTRQNDGRGHDHIIDIESSF